jgi:hypothetical protein
VTAADWIAQAKAVTGAATEGPWWYVDEQPTLPAVAEVDGRWIMSAARPSDDTEEDADFIATSRTMLPAAVAAIEAVLALLDERDEETGEVYGEHEIRDASLIATWEIRAEITAALDGAS